MTRGILWAAFLLTVAYCVLEKARTVPVTLMGLVAIGLWMWGCGRYAGWKGYSPVLGALVGILNLVGLVVLALLPAKARSDLRERSNKQ